jgi:hypothetical protein
MVGALGIEPRLAVCRTAVLTINTSLPNGRGSRNRTVLESACRADASPIGQPPVFLINQKLWYPARELNPFTQLGKLACYRNICETCSFGNSLLAFHRNKPCGQSQRHFGSVTFAERLVRRAGFEPAPQVWKTHVLSAGHQRRIQGLSPLVESRACFRLLLWLGGAQ